MAETGVRVALLARAGKARDQLHRALNEAGAQIVAEGDPAELDPAQVAGQAPTVFLVSLEPAIETALERFDELLAAPGVEVMFDDAEVTGKLDGWDLNRWARHLASKLLGSEGLPPAPDGSPAWSAADVTLGPGAPPTPAELMDHAKLEDYTTDASDLANSVPVSASLMPAVADDGSGDDLAEASFTWDDSQAATDDSGAEPLHGDPELGEPVRFSSFEQEPSETGLSDLDADVAALAAQLEAFEKNDQRFAAVDPDFETAPSVRAPVMEVVKVVAVADEVVAEAVLAAPAARAAVSFDFSNLALAPIEGEPPTATPARIVPEFSAGSNALKPKTALDAEVSTPAQNGLGAVIILAGLGGPDAVRQLLSSLPEKLAVPVLLYQHLEVGKHERLVEQLAKISRLPVVLACEGAVPEAGKVTLLPAGLTAIANGNSLYFTPGTLSQLIAALPAQESMIIVLSGAEVQLVPMILSVKEEGGLVLAQDPEVCFDAAAAEAMRREGVAVYPALGLARQIAARWPL